ncbi:MAG TPA: hypothetical protein VGV87_20320 [Blastocatellia bacterium]|nr:hypothetical protein [Blastocatellia bacterium]
MTTELNDSKGAWRALRWIIAVTLAGYLIFCFGSSWQYVQKGYNPLRILVVTVAPLIIATVCWLTRDRWWPIVRTHLGNHTDAIDGLSDRHIGLWIALAAGLGLYAELMTIRLHGSFFQLFAYFKNVSLLSCFLGLGIGYAQASRRPLTTPLVLPFLALQIILMHLLRFTEVASLLQNPLSEQLTFGLDQADSAPHILTVYGFLGAVFAFNALCFIPLGHLASRLMTRQSKLKSYSWNLTGSLLGIVLFYCVSFLWAPPSIWILVAALALIAFLYRNAGALLPSALAAVILLASLWMPIRPNEVDLYSPYQILTMTVRANGTPELRVNNNYFQSMWDLGKEKQWADFYGLPYSFKSNPQDVLIVGSGAGNDVSAAIRNGAGQVDAVEIDPAILSYGQLLHPESPYQAGNVNPIVADARAFIRHTDKKYDLIVYGLLDSHTLLSGMSSIRMDSFVYTVEGFREARARLKKDGVICLSFALLRTELGRKLFLMLQEAFDGQAPVVYQAFQSWDFVFVIGEGLAGQSFNESTGIRESTASFADSGTRADKSTDDWPFFYMPVRKYPLSYIVMILILLGISVVFIRQLSPGSGGGFSPSCFFLGAGFMLVETKGITELALVYGSTWIVIGAVIAAILILAFLANLLVIRTGALHPLITYGLLSISLLAGLFWRSQDVSITADWLGRATMTLLLTMPLFFSGFAFSAELGRSPSVATAFSSNLLGAMLGGFLEYNSMYFGFRFLYVLALIMYGCAFLGSIGGSVGAKMGFARRSRVCAG